MIPGERYANGSTSEEALFWFVVIGIIVVAWLLVREKNRRSPRPADVSAVKALKEGYYRTVSQAGFLSVPHGPPTSSPFPRASEKLRSRRAILDTTVHLRGAHLYAADLQGFDLREADLSKANLVMADFRNALIEGMKVKDADLRGANFFGAIGEAKLSQARWRLGCIWPDGKIDDGKADRNGREILAPDSIWR
jgi:hypothetical protein